MRVVHLIYNFLIGGAQTMLVDIASAQSESHEVWVICVNDEVDSELVAQFSSKVRFLPLGRRPGSRNPFSLLRLNLILKKISPRVIHCHSDNLSSILWFGNLALATITVHDTAINARAIMCYNQIIAISNAVKLVLLANDIPANKVHMIPNGVPTAAIQCSGRDIKGNSPVIRVVCVARLVPEKKGQDILIAGIAKPILSGVPIHVDFIGGGDSVTELRDLASRLGCGASISFVGELNRRALLRKLSSYDLLVHPARFEGFGLTVAEAMAAGVPVIVSNIEGPREIVDGGTFGGIFESENPFELAKQLLDFSMNREFWENRAVFAREHVQAMYSVTSTSQRYLEIYEDH